MNANTVIHIGELYESYVQDFNAAGFQGDDVSVTATNMAKLWWGMMLLQNLGIEATDVAVPNVPPRLHLFVAGWLVDIRERIARGLGAARRG